MRSAPRARWWWIRAKHPRIGSMQYGETLPLKDHEVVLTFDDGPLPHNSNKVLDILASECVKATFFIVGRMANVYPDGVRKLRAAGHTIGTHSQNHPLSFNRMTVEQAKKEVDDGIASVTAALGAPLRGGAVLPDSRPAACPRRRGLSRLAGHPDLERRFPRRRLAAYFVGAGLSAGDQPYRGQGQRDPAAARHPGQNRPARCRRSCMS